MLTVIAEFPIANTKDVKAATQRARLLGTLVQLPNRQRNGFGTATRELAQNALQHANGGRIEFRIHTDDSSSAENSSPFIEAAVFDTFGGQLEIAAIIGQTTGPDCGLRRALSLTDRLLVERVDDGKVVCAAVSISLEAADLDDTDLAEWAGVLRTRRTQSALASTQRRSRELAERLTTLQSQRAELESDLEQSQSLNETLTLLSLVASKTDNAVLIMDEDGLVTWANDAFMRMTGYTMHDAAGVRPDRLLCGPLTSRDSVHELEQAFKLGHGVAEEFQQYRREGSTSWISLSLTPVHDDEGIVSRWIGIGSDITKRKEAERALQMARDAAETASKLKGEFLANISHEIRTPMNSIIGMTDLALCTRLDEDQRDYLTTVKQSAESLLELLNDVLDLSKIESGRLDINNVPFDLPALVMETLKPLKYVAQQKHLSLEASVPAEVPTCIIGDPLRVRQILINLVGNAIKFTAQGEVEVTVEKQWEADGQVGLHFVVADTGIGISADKLDQIFEAFSQADASVTRQYGGTGLGLAITSELLRLMKGRVWVQSEPGKGSRFHFTLKSRIGTPEDIAAMAEEKVQATAVKAANPFETSCRPLKVLVADDHSANRHLIARILEKRGHKISFAKNGHEVLSVFDGDTFDVVLMDVQMPDMGGFEATAGIRMRERESQSHVPIIAVTAHAMQSDREACLTAGMDAYLSKPISAMELVTLVDSLGNNQVNLSLASTLRSAGSSREHAVEPPGPRSVAHSKKTAVLPERFTGTLARFDNDEELLLEQIQYFLNDGPTLLDMMAAAIQNNDGATLQIAAHRLKNLCATFDDNDTAGCCGQLEVVAASGNLEHIHNFSEPARNGTLRLITELQSFCSDL